MLNIGCHLSKREGYLFMAKEALSIDATTFQFFTRNPRGGAVKEADPKDVEAFSEYAKKHDMRQICGYAPYDVEPANPDVSKKDFALMVMSEDLAHLQEMPVDYYLVRPGSAPGVDEQTAIDNVCDALNAVITSSQNTMLLIDTMSGEGDQVGYSFEQIAKMIDGVKLADKVGVCMDTSAVWAAGYDIKGNLSGVLDEFDRIIGLDRLCCLHLNDSKEKLGSKVDRHARIGEGEIGFDALSEITNDQRLEDRAYYLEEPKSTLVTYERDISRFRQAYTQG